MSQIISTCSFNTDGSDGIVGDNDVVNGDSDRVGDGNAKNTITVNNNNTQIYIIIGCVVLLFCCLSWIVVYMIIKRKKVEK